MPTRWRIHFIALPTAWVAGFSPEATLRIGSTTAWVSDQVGSAAGFMELKDEGHCEVLFPHVDAVLPDWRDGWLARVGGWSVDHARRRDGATGTLTPIVEVRSVSAMNALADTLLELIRRTSAEIPDDVQAVILAALEREKKGTIAESAMKIIEQNIQIKSYPTSRIFSFSLPYYFSRGTKVT